MQTPHKYARIERERRFLLDRFPHGRHAVSFRRITDRYIEGTRLRLREQREDTGALVFKLTQKIPGRGTGALQGLITNFYLSEDEFRLLAQLPSARLSKTRFSIPPFGIDIFEETLDGLILAEAEFDSESEAEALEFPTFARCEVSDDHRFTGGELVRATRNDIESLLGEYGISFDAQDRK